MDIVTDSFNKMSINQIYSQLSSKYAQRNIIEKTNQAESPQKKDYIEQNFGINKYEENFAKVLDNFKQTSTNLDNSKAAAFKLDMLQKAASTTIDSSVTDNTIATQSNLNKILLQLKGEENAS